MSLRAAHETAESRIPASAKGRESREMPPIPDRKPSQNVEERLGEASEDTASTVRAPVNAWS
jgi:hypothetical protein